MKKVLLILSLAGFLTATAQKNAYIEQTELLKSLKGYEENVKLVDSTKKVYSQEIQDAQKKLNDKFQALIKNYNVTDKDTDETLKAKLSDLDKSKFELYQDESKMIEKSTKNYDLMLQTLFKDKVQPLLDKLNNSIDTYAKKNKIDMVFILENIQPALAYIDKSKNITSEIKKML
jgi:Skp family chaperone for outer membrane proteins